MRDEVEESTNESSELSSLIPHPSSLSFITLLTDFGTSDYFVGAMKGAILDANPRARIIDITHDVPPHDVEAGAFTLLAAYSTFPKKTIHLAVVDPGVGSERRPILVESQDYFFIGPDNGLFSYICERESQSLRVFHLTDDEYFRHPLSHTFHGRDLFAPVAGALSKGIEPSRFGPEINDYVRLAPISVRRLSEGALEATVIHVDRFGNCITSITCEDLTEEMIRAGARLEINGHEIKTFRQFFADAPTDELFAVWGSAGFLEIAAFKTSAARLLDIERGQRVKAVTSDK